jgi:cytoplasmic iron level regulating protein YaaA (DUF328/UPF0246 family)
VLLIVPPSEAKRPPPDDGPALDLDGLSFPVLTTLRRRILDAVIATSDAPDALQRFHVGPAIAEEVARNAALHDLPTLPVLDVYSGPFHEGLAAERWSPAARDRARRSLVIVSALWGALRPVDRIPTYRLHVCSRLIGMDGLEPTWRTILPDVLAGAADPDGVVIDLRSPAHQAMGRPSGLGDRTVTVRVTDAAGDGRTIGDVVSKRTRGAIARHLLEAGTAATRPDDLAAELAARWRVDLRPPTSPGSPWTLSVVAPRLT